MSDNYTLTNQFLIAMPTLEDPNFFHSVTYICEHNESGSMGIVINQPLDLKLGAVLEQMNVDCDNEAISSQSIFFGGPINNDKGFVIHHPQGKWDSTLTINKHIAVTSSKDILEALSDGDGPQDHLVAIGYAGWGPGQLEEEITNNAWINVPADNEIIFKTPIESRWKKAAALTGIDLSKLSSQIGHA